MQEAFAIVLWVVVIGAVLVGIATLVGRGRLYDEIGRGGLSLRDERDGPPPEPEWTSTAGAAIRDEEIRQLLEARNERRARRGEEPLDVDEELRRLTAPAQPDAALRDEVRQLVIARNERRARRGKEPLDVEAEVERQLRELG